MKTPDKPTVLPEDVTGPTGEMRSAETPTEDPTPRPPKRPAPFRGEGFTIHPAKNPKEDSRMRLDVGRDIVSGEFPADAVSPPPELKDVSDEQTAEAREAWRRRWKEQAEKTAENARKTALETDPLTPEDEAQEEREDAERQAREAADPFREALDRNDAEARKREDAEVLRLRAELETAEPDEKADEWDEPTQVDRPKK